MEVADAVLGQVTIDILSDSQRQNEQVSSASRVTVRGADGDVTARSDGKPFLTRIV
jgi:hypothetical protein